MVESQPSKLLVAGSNPVSRSKKVEGRGQKEAAKRRLLPSEFCPQVGPRSSGVEHVLGKDGVTSSNLVEGSSSNDRLDRPELVMKRQDDGTRR